MDFSKYEGAKQLKYTKMGVITVIKALYNDCILLELIQNGYDDFRVIAKNYKDIEIFNEELKRRGYETS